MFAILASAIAAQQGLGSDCCFVAACSVLADVRLQAAADTELTVSTTLDEASTVYYVVVANPSAWPTPAQVCS